MKPVPVMTPVQLEKPAMRAARLAYATSMRSCRRPIAPRRGAALLLAMVILTMVATIASGMVWQQNRAIQVERSRMGAPPAAPGDGEADGLPFTLPPGARTIRIR